MSDKPTIRYSDFDQLAQAAGHYTRKQIDWFEKFGRFSYLDPYNALGSTREYIFFTKPDLHLFENTDATKLNPEIANDTFFKDMHERYIDVLKQLQITNNQSTSPFINLIFNSVQSSLDLPTISAGEVDGANNIYGDNIPYRWSSGSSDNNHEFSLEFEDTKYLEVYMLFKIWDEYERKKSKGAVSPPDENYIFDKILHDQVAAYKLIIGEDGETIIYFAKLWGVYPKGVPREAFSNVSDNKLSFSVNFNATFVEDMDPTILSEFNLLVGEYPAGSNLPLYNRNLKTTDGRWAKMPYIIYDNQNNIDPMGLYKLKWRL